VNTKYVDPTNSSGGLYVTNLIRSLSGGYPYGSINMTTSYGESYYNSLQVQVNRRFGRGFQMSSNYTWAKTLSYGRQRWVDDYLTKSSSGRPHVVNINFGYRTPDFSKMLGAPSFTKYFLDGWNINGQGSYFSGTLMTVSCTAASVPANLGNYWTGTPTGGIPFRCQMTGDMWLPSGATPGSIGSKAVQDMWYPFDPSHFVLPPATSLGIGNTPPTLTLGPGMENWDISISKSFPLGKGESRLLQLRVETFNTFNHFNPSNPSTALTYNFTTGLQTTSTFGSITGAQNTPRKLAGSVRFTF
jgi:hypothetical protein